MNDMNDKINCGLYRRKTKILRDDLESLEIKTLLIVTTHRPQEFAKTPLYLVSKALHAQNGKIEKSLIALEKLYHILEMQGKRRRLEGEKERQTMKNPREMGERPTSHKPSTKLSFHSPITLSPTPRVRGPF